MAVVIEYKCFRLSLQSHQLSVDPVDDEACSQPKPDNDWVLCDRIPCGSHHGHIGIMQLSIQSKVLYYKLIRNCVDNFTILQFHVSSSAQLLVVLVTSLVCVNLFPFAN